MQIMYIALYTRSVKLQQSQIKYPVTKPRMGVY